MTPWQAITWETARASGFVAYLLITFSVAVGLALTQHWQSPRWPRIVNAEMHNFLALVGLVFVAVHVLAVAVDPFTHFGLVEVLLPFVSHYRPLWMGLGITALYLGLAILVSTWLRPRIGYSWWRRIHVLTLVGYVLVTLHGLGTGSDTRTWYGFLIYAGSIALIGRLLIVRLLVPATERSKPHPTLAGLTGVGLLAITVWALLGPMQSGWNALAGGRSNAALVAATATSVTSPTGSTTSGSGTSGTTTSSGPLSAGFSGSFTGTLTQSGPDALGNTTLTLSLSLAITPAAKALVTLQGQQTDGGLSVSSGDVTLGITSQPSLYTGIVTGIQGGNIWEFAARVASRNATLYLSFNVHFGSGDAIQGSITASPAS